MQTPLNETSRAKDYIQPTSTTTAVTTASPEQIAPPAYKPLISTSTTAQVVPLNILQCICTSPKEWSGSKIVVQSLMSLKYTIRSPLYARLKSG